MDHTLTSSTLGLPFDWQALGRVSGSVFFSLIPSLALAGGDKVAIGAQSQSCGWTLAPPLLLISISLRRALATHPGYTDPGTAFEKFF